MKSLGKSSKQYHLEVFTSSLYEQHIYNMVKQLTDGKLEKIQLDFYVDGESKIINSFSPKQITKEIKTYLMENKIVSYPFVALYSKQKQLAKGNIVNEDTNKEFYDNIK
ncbi:Hypothetical_protein [Hexamita inflata]|uniref:Hypothetical_protein n=1 Tax=Hexamita inflata TaxID=28002 RepID=A0AA86TXZ9_9EUKA|nr:Hypothetical protein HINF_LOCUS21495 [Hexamita inflata]